MSWDTFFFRAESGPLLGCHHTSAPDRDRGCAVVLIHSFGQEYIEQHRALRQLAVLLSQSGFSVLRFDLSGTGDSSGACEDQAVDLWLRDIDAAIDEMRRRGSTERLCLVGVRLGGALATRIGALRRDVDYLALWDPVVDGKAYLEELADLHATMLRYAHVQQDPSDARSGSGELLGFPMSDATRRSIAALDTLALNNRPAREILVIETNQKIPQHDLCQHLKKLEVDVTHHNLPAPELWEWLEDFGKVRVPLNVLRAIIDWLDEACP